MNEKYSKRVVSNEVQVDTNVVGDPVSESSVADVNCLVFPPHINLKNTMKLFRKLVIEINFLYRGT